MRRMLLGVLGHWVVVCFNQKLLAAQGGVLISPLECCGPWVSGQSSFDPLAPLCCLTWCGGVGCMVGAMGAGTLASFAWGRPPDGGLGRFWAGGA